MRIAASRVLGVPGPAAITVEDGLIAAIDPVATAPERTLSPGFIDLQVNGVDDLDVATAGSDDWDRFDAMLQPTGVTTWCPTLVTAPLGEMAARARAVPARPSIVGVHLEGPFLGGMPGAHPRELLVPIDHEWLTALPDNVRIVTLAPELVGARDAVRSLTSRGVTVSLGHSSATVDEMRSCIAAGARMVTHLFNGMPPLHHREPGVVGATLTDDRVVAGLIADLVHVDAVALEIAFRAKPGRIALVTDAVAWRSARIGRIAITHDGMAPRLSDGTLAGSSLTMDVAIRNTVQAANVPLAAALTAASTTPADVLGLADRGRIEVGRRADLVLLDDDLVVRGVWHMGAEVA